MFENENFDEHERVVHINDKSTGLRAIVAIHSTALGPAGGGCRLWTYEDTSLALKDALRLSRGMSYKNALAGLRMGGGKAVILGPVDPARRTELFEAFGEAVNQLGGQYITAEDVGVRVPDMQAVASRTSYVSGLSSQGGAGGDPSPYTARGVRLAMEAVASHSLQASSLEGLKVAVQGLGGVGGNLCRELSERGAKLVVADVNPQRVTEVCDKYGAEIGHVDTVLLENVDIISPCALGGVLTAELVSKLQAKAVVGGANNQLATPSVGKAIYDRGITYAPDYLINSGGIIMVAAEYFGENDQKKVDADVEKIFDRTLDVLVTSKERRQPTSLIADEVAQKLISEASRKGSSARKTLETFSA
nr:Glu/Leu/Phe/Val dehydrogenase dimerization domain-containing protein [Hyphomonas sp. Mor2]